MSKRDRTMESIRKMVNGEPVEQSEVNDAVSDMVNEMCEYHVWFAGESHRIGRLRHEDIVPRFDEWCQEKNVGSQEDHPPAYLFMDHKLFMIRRPIERGSVFRSYDVMHVQKFEELIMAFGDPLSDVSGGWKRIEMVWYEG